MAFTFYSFSQVVPLRLDQIPLLKPPVSKIWSPFEKGNGTTVKLWHTASFFWGGRLSSQNYSFVASALLQEKGNTGLCKCRHRSLRKHIFPPRASYAEMLYYLVIWMMTRRHITISITEMNASNLGIHVPVVTLRK